MTDWVQSQQRGNQSTPAAPVDPDAVMRMLEVDRLRLKLGQLIQEGTFGRVYQVRYYNDIIGLIQLYNVTQGTLLNDDEQEEDVYVKTVVAGSSHTQSQILIGKYI